MSRRLLTSAFVILILAQSLSTRASDILQNIPHDALGAVVIKSLHATDAKVGQLLTTLKAQYPTPLIFLEAVTGIRDGLDAQGDFMLAMLPPDGNGDGSPQYCVWLPVTDYDRLLTLLEASPAESISAIRIADEDLIVARQGSWAVIMDPDQRPRLEQMLKDDPHPPAALAKWKNWTDANDAAIILLEPGIELILGWSAEPPESNDLDTEHPADDLFGQLEVPAEDDPFAAAPVAEPASNPLYDPIRRAVHQWIVRSPTLEDIVSQAEAIGVAVRLDDAGNARASLRLKSTNDHAWNSATNKDAELPAALSEKGDFIVHGAGRLPPALMPALASLHVRRMLDDLKTRDRIELDDALATTFEDAFIDAASDVTAWSVVHQPGDLKTGVHNNKFLVVRVASAKSFLSHAADAMEHWNTMHRETESDTSYVFDIEEAKLGDRVATQYLLDVAATGGLPAMPEMRKMMEQFFGPGGKMRLWLVPIDEQTVLLAAAMPEQVTAALQRLDDKLPIDWNQPELAAANKLSPEASDWRLFFSPRDYRQWKRLETEAMNNGVPVIGAKPTKDLPLSPPILFSGNAHADELEAAAAIPAETLKNAGDYLAH
jgi:hypothetical protein